MKFCVDCAHSSFHVIHRPGGICLRVQTEPNPVTGRQFALPCAAARAKAGRCGPDAKLFEPKPVPPPPPPPPPPKRYVIEDDCVAREWENIVHVSARPQRWSEFWDGWLWGLACAGAAVAVAAFVYG